MKKISYVLVLITVAGLCLVSLWVYSKYFRQDGPKYLTFTVTRGDIQESVRVRGDVVSQKIFDMEFPFSGIVKKIYVTEGEKVKAGDPLMTLDTADYSLEAKGYEALIVQKQAALAKLQIGATTEDIKVYETKVANAKVTLEDAEKNLTDKLNDAYTKSDDAIRNRVDQLFTNPRSENPGLSFSISDLSLKAKVEADRRSLETNIFPRWQTSLNNLGTGGDVSLVAGNSKTYLNQIKSFVDAIAGITSNPNNTTVTSAWRTDVYTARTNINTASSALVTAEESYNSAKSAYDLSQHELDLKKAASRPEDIEIALAQIDEARSKLAAVNEKINKSTIRSPVEAEVVKILPEKGEVFNTGQTAVSLFALGYKVTADITELEISKINEVDSNDVEIQLDAFPGQMFAGKVLSVEPQVIVKDGDKYYRVNVGFDTGKVKVRSGMSADLIILTFAKQNILKVPSLAIYERDNKKYTAVLENGKLKEIPIVTGISDGNDTEIISGLSVGQEAVISAD